LAPTDGISGLHHVTAIAGDPQINIDYYMGFLGLRLVKLTINFDDPGTYHLYYGDGVGHLGTIMTFLPWPTAFPGGREPANSPPHLSRFQIARWISG